MDMPYQVLYRTYRPNNFSEVVGQDHIIKVLKNGIKANKIAHAYLFCGPRGTGKTTIAKIFAKAINCAGFINEPCEECDTCKAINEGRNPDVVELDAASNNGVDDIRNIINEAAYSPTMSTYKVYIIDEVHMLSTSAFNALLKTLEEPPKHVIFILATTDPQKILPTVISRCQRLNFSKLTKNEMVSKMKEILDKENLAYEESALNEIATLADGGMRDALSILEEVLSYSLKGVNLKDVEMIFGLTSTKELISLYEEACKDEKAKLVLKLRDMYKTGRDLKRVAIDLLIILKEALLYSEAKDESILEKCDIEQIENILKLVNTNKLYEDISILQDALKELNYSGETLAYIELAFIKMTRGEISRDKTMAKASELTSEYKKEEAKKIIEEDEYDIDSIAKLLCTAKKEEKEKDNIIFNKLELYKFHQEYKKYYDLLTKSKVFASCKDAILVLASRDIALAINDSHINKGFYYFFNKEFGVDKVIIAIDSILKTSVIEKYQYYRNNPHDPVYIKKYELILEPTRDEKIDEVFGVHN